MVCISVIQQVYSEIAASAGWFKIHGKRRVDSATAGSAVSAQTGNALSDFITVF
jgi:hypothetical protein